MNNIHVHDGLVPQELIESIYQLLLVGSFKHSHVAFTDSPYKTQAMDLNDKKYPQIEKLASIIHPLIPDVHKYHLDAVYANAYSFADVPMVHQDTQYDNELTVLYYANPVWDVNYGGETVFLDHENGELVKAVLPKPGRILIFQADYFHCGRIPNRLCPGYRYTIAFKLFRKYK